MRALRLEPPTHNQRERLKRRTRLTSAGGYARSIGDRGPWHPARCARHRPRERRLRDLLRGDLDRCRAVSAADLCPVAPHVHRGFAVRIGRGRGRPRATRRRSGGRGHRDPRAAVRPGRRAVAHRGRVRRALRRLAGDAMIWTGVLVASAACYGLKLAGLSLPQRWLQNTRVQRTVPLIPVALLAALVATQTFSTGQHLVLDVRAAALGVALIAVLLRAPFLVVVVAGAATAALLRLI